MKLRKIFIALVIVITSVLALKNSVHAVDRELYYTEIGNCISFSNFNKEDNSYKDVEPIIIGENTKTFYFDETGADVSNSKNRAATTYIMDMHTQEKLYKGMGVEYNITVTSRNSAAKITSMKGVFSIEDWYDDIYTSKNIDKTQSGNYSISDSDMTYYMPPSGVQLYAKYHVKVLLSNGVTSLPTLDEGHPLVVL